MREMNPSSASILSSGACVALFQRSSDAVFVVGECGEVCHANDEALRRLGYSLEALRAMRFADLMIGDEQPLVDARLKQAAVRGQVIFEGVQRRKDGLGIPVEVNAIHVSEEGNFHIFAVCRDVSERRGIESFLQDRLDAEERFSKIAATAPGAIYSFRVTPEGQFTIPYASPRFEEVTGVDPRPLVNSLDVAYAAIHPMDLPALKKSVEEAVMATAPWTHRFRVLHPRRGLVWLEGRTMPELSTAGGLFWHGFLIDVSEQRRAELLADGQRRTLEMIALGRPLRQILESLVEALETVAFELKGSILLLDADGRHLRHGAAPSLPDEYNSKIDGIEIGPCVGCCGTAAYRKTPVYVADIASDPLWAPYRDLALQHGLRACWSTPMLNGAGEVLGTLALYQHTPGLPDARHRALIDIVTHTGTIAITQTREAEALRKSEESYRMVVDSTYDIIWEVDAAARYTYVSPRATDLMGYRQEDLIGRSPLEFLPRHEATRMKALLEQHFREKKPFRELEVDYFDAHGRCVTLESSGTPIFDSAGNLRGFRGSARDISARRRAEAGMREQFARVTLLNQIVRQIGAREDAPTILRVAACRLEEHLPLDFCAVLLVGGKSGEYAVRAMGKRTESMAGDAGLGLGQELEIERALIDPASGSAYRYAPDLPVGEGALDPQLAATGLGSAVFAPFGMNDCTYGVLVAGRHAGHGFSQGDCEFLQHLGEHLALAIHEVRLREDLKEANRELRETQKAVLQQERLRALGQMASGIAHDINNAISPISLYAELLQADPSLSDQAREFLAIMRQASQGVAGTVNRLREFYRKREVQTELRPVQLNRLAQEVANLTRARWVDIPQAYGILIDVQFDLTSNLPEVGGIESEIREALINLIFNAVDAMPEGGTISIRTGLLAAGTHAYIEISDTGLGMDDEVRLRCVEPFFTTKGERGTGLGLAMVLGTAQRHDASLEIQSELGKGTHIRLAFPLRSVAELTPPSQGTSPLPHRYKVLLVDDDPIILKAMRTSLQMDHHEVVTAVGGQAAIEVFSDALLAGKPFELVITDLGMPRIDGRAVAEAVKRTAPDVPVILLTGWGQRLIDSEDVPPHVDCVVSKPPKLAEIRNAVARVTRKSGASVS